MTTPESPSPDRGSDTTAMPAVRPGMPAPATAERGTDEQDGPEEAAARRRPRRTLRGGFDAVRRWAASLTDRGQETDPEQALGRARILFAVVVVLYPTYQLLTRGRLFLGGSMWAETGTNYYALATSPRLVDRLFGTDAGYIPLPQRLIAYVGQELGLPAGAVPYFYVGSAFVLAGLLVGSVCLPVFRPVLASDGLRFGLALAMALVADFETRTFINFTYFAVVPLAAVTALAASRPRAQVPGWAWVLPLFMLSKPGVLAVLPAMVVVAVLVGGTRFRRITLVSVVAGLVQLTQLAVSSSSGTSLLQSSDQTALSKAYTAVKYTLGMLGRSVLGPANTWGVYPWMFTGIAVLLVAAAALLLMRARSGPLVVVGASLVAFTMVLDSFSFPASFSRDMALLGTPAFDRRFVVAVFGGAMVVAGVIATLTDSTVVPSRFRESRRAVVGRVARPVGVALFALWFVVGGWVTYTATINQPFGVPVGNVSQWENLSQRLADPAEPTLCIPLDPFGWIYGRNCQVLVDDKVIPFVFGWSALPTSGSDADPAGADDDPTGTDADGRTSDGPDQEVSLDLPVPRAVSGGTVASLALMVRPEAGTSTVRAEAFLTTRDGDVTTLDAEAAVPADGGLLQFTDVPTAAVDDVVDVRIVFDGPVDVAGRDPLAGTQTTIVLWMGQP